MKTKFKYVVLFAAALSLGLGSCSKNENESGKESGESTRMSLSFSYPQTYADGDNNATADETKVLRVDVFIYNTSNVLLKHETYNTNTDFTHTAGSSIWTVNKKIVTTVGKKNIYVGVNLSDNIANKIASDGPRSVQDIAAVTDLGDATKGFAMFSRKVAEPELTAKEDDAVNTVNVTVARLLAKVFVKKDASLPTTATIDVIGGTIQGLEFAVVNANKKIFSYRAYVAGAKDNAFDDPNYGTVAAAELGNNFMGTSDYSNVNENTTSVTSTGSNVIYTPENTSSGVRENEHTYVSIRGTYVPSKMVSWNNETKKLSDATAITAKTTFYKVIADGKNYFFAAQSEANAYATAKGSAAVEYTTGLCYYKVFLNPETHVGENKFDVLRNTIYSVNVTKINGLGEGSNSNTENPIVEDTKISVVVNIEKWNVSNQDAEL